MEPEQPTTRLRWLDRRTFLAVGAGGATAIALGIPLLGRSSSSSVGNTPSTSGPTTSSTAGAATPTYEGVTTTIEDGYRIIRSTGLPDHPLDPSYRYVADASEQDWEFRVTTTPTEADSPTEVVTGLRFGVHVDGVPFDPATAGFFQGDPSSGWLQDANHLDVYGAHTQPTGAYHYHRVTDLWGGDPSTHGALVGWAADGFPVYLRWGYAEATDPSSDPRELTSSWRLRSGTRTGGPGGTYDGTWVQDYEYVAGAGDLDQCNGRRCVTPEFPDGTYAYFVTESWPYIPRWLRGTPDSSFLPRRQR